MKKLIVALAAFLALAPSAKAQKNTPVDDCLQYVPMASALGLGLLGVEGKHELREQAALTATAFLTMNAMVGASKIMTDERRPDGSDRNAFPSGHAARAFMGAELVRHEYGWQWGLTAYGVATGVGCLRIIHDRHYTHDVLAGAAMGILSADIAYWLLPLERKLFKWDRQDAQLTALPTCQPWNHAVGVALSLRF